MGAFDHFLEEMNSSPYDNLFDAVHRVLVLRLYQELDSTKEGLIAWNDLITAHDAVVDFRDEQDAVEQA